MHNSKNFIIIDDDALNSLQFKMIIKYDENCEEETTPITVGEKGLDFMDLARFMPKAPANTILVKEVNIPNATMWQFLDRVNKFPKEMKDRFKIYVLSSSNDNNDRELVMSHPMVKGYLVKPMSREMIMDIVSGNMEKADSYPG